MAVPKRKTSKARRDSRRASNFKVAEVQLNECPQCHSLVPSHTVCKTCKAQYINIHDSVSRMHTNQIFLCLHCKLLRYKHYEILLWIFFRFFYDMLI